MYKSKEDPKHYTTIEQSKKLLELGLNPESADIVYIVKRNDCRDPWELAAKEPGNVYTCLKDFDITMCLSDYAIPCWSLGSLLDVMPKSLEDKVNYYEITVYYSKSESEWYLGYITIDMRRTLEVFHNTSLIEAAYSMVLWLLKNNYINRTNNVKD